MTVLVCRIRKRSRRSRRLDSASPRRRAALREEVHLAIAGGAWHLRARRDPGFRAREQ